MPSLHENRHEGRAELLEDGMFLRGRLDREELSPMNALEEVKAHLMATHEEYRRLAGQHSEYAKKLDALESQPHLTYENELEETRLKKLKLHIKDQMEAIVNQYRSQQVA
jgi:uncharacterized protein YdcH (DUF465 family)